MPRNRSNRLARNKEHNSLPLIFGLGLRDRVLLCLVVNGPMHVRHIARTIQSSPSKVFGVVEHLSNLGLVVKNRQSGMRKYVALNRSLQVYPALETLLLALDRRWPVSRAKRILNSAWEMPNGTALPKRLCEEIFASRTRTRVLVAIAATHKATLWEISMMLKLHPTSTLAAVKIWEREGIILLKARGGKRLVSLHPAFAAATELKHLLKSLIKCCPEYRSLCNRKNRLPVK